jgi:hypothetical protein
VMASRMLEKYPLGPVVNRAAQRSSPDTSALRSVPTTRQFAPIETVVVGGHEWG